MSHLSRRTDAVSYTHLDVYKRQDNNNKSIVKGQTMYNWETHDNQDKVIVDSINAIERRREHMTDEQLRKAYTELQTGLGPDIYSQLCDRKASDNFQG